MLNELLLKVTPKFAVRLFAGPYLAGETDADALAVADAIHRRHRLHATLDLLGEAITDRAGVDASMAEYRRLVGALADRPYAWASVKLSSMGQGVDQALCDANAEELVRQAAAVGSFVRFDMEDHPTTDRTIATYRKMRELGLHNCGLVLQSRLWRTPDDIAALHDLQPSVRLCIGIYAEPASLATTSKPEMKQRLLEQLGDMLDHGWTVGIATHDEAVIAKARAMLAERGIGPQAGRAEFQMLLGVPRAALQRELVAEGWTVRLYVPYGRDWYPYSTRRLMESPDILGHVIRNLFSARGRVNRT